MRIFWGAIKKYISLRHINCSVSKVTEIAKLHDIVLCCAGSSIGSIWDAPLPPLHFIKGQNIAYDFNNELNFADATYDALICGKYLIIDRIARRLLFGATYEYMGSLSNISEQPDLRVAEDLIHPDALISNFIPSNHGAASCFAAVRVASCGNMDGSSRVPLIIQHPHHGNVWAITAMGSRGLLYHSLLAKDLVDKIST